MGARPCTRCTLLIALDLAYCEECANAELIAAREENRKLRKHWGRNGAHIIYQCASGKFFMYGTQKLYDTEDEAINDVCGIRNHD